MFLCEVEKLWLVVMIVEKTSNPLNYKLERINCVIYKLSIGSANIKNTCVNISPGHTVLDVFM